MTDIFTSDVPSPKEPQVTDPAEILKGILNERGEQKYDSLPKALEGLAHAQQYIPTLKQSLEEKEQELARLREELGKRESVEDVVSKLITKQQPAPVEAPVVTTPSSPQLDEQSVGALIERVLSQRSEADQAKANVSKVQEALIAAYGERTQEIVAAKAAELGITSEDIGLMAQKSPKVVLELFSKSSVQTKPTTVSSVNTNAFLPKDSGEMPKPSKSLLQGATTRDVLEYQRQLRDYIYKKYNVET